MRAVDQDLVEKWFDGSIRRKAKGEAMRKFHRAFGYTDDSDMLGRFMSGRFEPTPDQHAKLREIIEEYWNFYNPQPQPAS